jgi:hypothetical protein
VNDGIVQGFGRVGFHWRFGRAVLGAISPKPAEDEFTQLWFRAALAIDPSLTPARLRLGRVLSRTDRHEEALGHLAHAGEADQPKDTRY